MEINTGKNESTFTDPISAEQKKTTVNSIQLTTFVSRICVNKIKFKDVWSFDEDNLYPNKVRATWMRSPSAKAASKVFAEFVVGDGFGGDDIPLNDNLLPFDVLRFAANELSVFQAFAVHVDYNVFGEKTGYTLVPFELCRVSLDEKYIYVKKHWDRYFKQDQKRYNIFNDNPEKVREEIEEAGGLDKYNGQIMYFKNTIRDVYPVAMCDEVLDDMQLEHEIGLYNLMNIQNNYPISAIFKIPQNLKDQAEQIEMELNLRLAKGAKNAGKLLAVPMPPSADGVKDVKLIEPISRDNIDGMFKYQKESARDDIFACYNQPPILAGISKDGMFNQDQFADAFDYYNSKTGIWRVDMSRALEMLFRNSIFGLPEEIFIEPKEYIVNRNVVNSKENGGQQDA